ncbi:MAG: ATP-dependent DNA ligase [Candidatus Woesearchaeota archaeon]
MLFAKLASVFQELEKISSGNAMRKILSDFFKKVPKTEIEQVAYLTTGRIATEYEDINIGMADKMVLRAIALASGRTEEEVNKVFKQKGDVGFAAEELCGRKRKDLSIKEVFEGLHKIAQLTGAGSQEAKTKILAGLLKNASPLEARYIARIVLGTLRLGVGDMTVLDSLSIAFTGTKENKARLEQAYHTCPDVGIIAKAIATKGLKGIDNIGVMVGRPIQMMLAQRVQKITMIQEKMPGLIDVEEKYDGERMQVHVQNGKIVIFSRRMENITAQFPDVAEQIKKNIRAKSFIVEGECVAVDTKGNLLPFQVLMQRRRKYEVEEYAKKIPVCLYLFDLLYLNGKSYIRQDLPVRQKALIKILRETKSLQFVKRVVTDKLDVLEDFFNKSISRGGEGIIAKSYSHGSVYKAGTRGWLWIKWKPEYIKGNNKNCCIKGPQIRGNHSTNYCCPGKSTW